MRIRIVSARLPICSGVSGSGPAGKISCDLGVRRPLEIMTADQEPFIRLKKFAQHLAQFGGRILVPNERSRSLAALGDVRAALAGAIQNPERLATAAAVD